MTDWQYRMTSMKVNLKLAGVFGVHYLIRLPILCRTSAMKLLEELSRSRGLKNFTRSRGNSARNAHSKLLEKVDMKVGQ